MNKKYNRTLSPEQREEQVKAYWARRDREEKTGDIYGWKCRTRAERPKGSQRLGFLILAGYLVAVGVVALLAHHCI